MILIADQLQDILERRLARGRLGESLTTEVEVNIWTSTGEVFAEVVLQDGSVLDEAERLVRRTAEELAKQGIKVDSIVRALWEIVSIEVFGSLPHSRFEANIVRPSNSGLLLRSGTRQHQVFVDVFWGAIDVLRHKLGMERSSDIARTQFARRPYPQRDGRTSGPPIPRPAIGPRWHQLLESATSPVPSGFNRHGHVVFVRDRAPPSTNFARQSPMPSIRRLWRVFSIACRFPVSRFVTSTQFSRSAFKHAGRRVPQYRYICDQRA